MSESQQLPPRDHYDDEIDLFELWDKLWSQRLFIVAITAIVVLLAVGYLLISKPVYQAEAYFLAPLKQDVQELSSLYDSGENGLNVTERYTPEKVYSEFQKNLKSRQVRREFFDNKELVKLYLSDGEATSVNDVFEKTFNEDLKVNLPKKGKGEVVSIYFQLTDQALSAELLNDFIQFSMTKTVRDLIKSINSEIETQEVILKDKMSAMKKLALLRRQDRIEQLEETLSLAMAADIIEARINDSANELNMDYMRGAKVIESEIEILKSRKSDDAFIPELRDLEEEHSYLTSIKLDKEKIQVAIIDQQAYIPEEPIKPKKILVLAISIALGGLLGIMLALVRSVIKSRKENLA